MQALNVKKYNRSIQIARKEANVKTKVKNNHRSAMFFIRMVMEGRDVNHHIPKSISARISLAKRISDYLANGFIVYNKQGKYVRRVPFCVTSDVITEINIIFLRDMLDNASRSSLNNYIWNISTARYKADLLNM